MEYHLFGIDHDYKFEIRYSVMKLPLTFAFVDLFLVRLLFCNDHLKQKEECRLYEFIEKNSVLA